MRVKICGITNIPDATAAVDAGADAIGLNFVAGPRQISVDTARDILRSLPPMVTAIALVRIEDGHPPEPLARLLAEARVSTLQIYGDDAPESLSRLKRQGYDPIPVVAVRDEGFADPPVSWMPSDPEDRPGAVHLDAYDPDREGGTGKTFRWDWVSSAREAGKLSDWPAIILAGGLNPDNVADAVRAVRPFAVDVSSGVEASPGRKDHDKMRAFVRNAKAALETL